MSRMVGECIAIPWDYCIPFFYGEYEGRLINGEDCKIDVDSKIRVYDNGGKQVGTDQVHLWYGNASHIKQLIENIEGK